MPKDLTALYKFENPVQPGRHWGTRRMLREVQEVDFNAGFLRQLSDLSGLFRLYLADVILGNRDRTTHGNALLAKSELVPGKFDVIPIDQSEAFFHPSTMICTAQLRRRLKDSGAQMLDGVESVLAEHGPEVVHQSFAKAMKLRGRASSFVSACRAEWFDRAEVDPEVLAQFLEHRIGSLAKLARKDHWLGVASIDSRGQYVLDLD